MGRGGGLRRRRHAGRCAEHPGVRRCGGGQRTDRWRGPQHHGDAVHPARCVAVGHRFGAAAHRAAARPVGPAGRSTQTPPSRRRHSRSRRQGRRRGARRGPCGPLLRTCCGQSGRRLPTNRRKTPRISPDSGGFTGVPPACGGLLAPRGRAGWTSRAPAAGPEPWPAVPVPSRPSCACRCPGS